MKYFDPPPEEIQMYRELLEPEEEKEINHLIKVEVFRWNENQEIVLEDFADGLHCST